MPTRRVFVASAGAAIVAAPSLVAQTPARRVVGFLNGGSAAGSAYLATAFRHGMQETGYVDGRNLTIDVRWTEGRNDRSAALVKELIGAPVDLLAVGGGAPVRRAAKDATSTIPIVFVTGADPLAEGLVANLGRPGANVTGVTVPTTSLNTKRLELMSQALPRGKTIAVLANPLLSWTTAQAKDVQAAARTLERTIHVVNATSEREIDEAFAAIAKVGAGGLLVSADPLYNGRLQQLVDLTRRHRVPAIFEWREFATAGGLMSYGSDIANGYREPGCTRDAS